MVKHKHEWDLLSDFCIHCGISRVHQLDAPAKCHREENVTAISHTRSKVRTKELMQKIKVASREKNDVLRTPGESDDPNSK